MRTALTIAGSDSGAGAGIQADLKTFAAHGVYGTCAITAVTAQNTLGVTMVEALPADLVTAQIEAVASDIGAHAVKTGMLATAAIVEAVAAAVRDLELPLRLARGRRCGGGDEGGTAAPRVSGDPQHS
jgi:hydroxymethylpyrimidine kinase/phosphomethylpyrimidine kinase